MYYVANLKRPHFAKEVKRRGITRVKGVHVRRITQSKQICNSLRDCLRADVFFLKRINS